MTENKERTRQDRKNRIAVWQIFITIDRYYSHFFIFQPAFSSFSIFCFCTNDKLRVKVVKCKILNRYSAKAVQDPETYNVYLICLVYVLRKFVGLTVLAEDQLKILRFATFTLNESYLSMYILIFNRSFYFDIS